MGTPGMNVAETSACMELVTRLNAALSKATA